MACDCAKCFTTLQTLFGGNVELVEELKPSLYLWLRKNFLYDIHGKWLSCSMCRESSWSFAVWERENIIVDIIRMQRVVIKWLKVWPKRKGQLIILCSRNSNQMINRFGFRKRHWFHQYAWPYHHTHSGGLYARKINFSIHLSWVGTFHMILSRDIRLPWHLDWRVFLIPTSLYNFLAHLQ